MRRRYRDCQREDGNCLACSLLSTGTDCKGKPIVKLELLRRAARMEQRELASLSGVDVRQIQRIEKGTINMSNVSLANAVALAEALHVNAKDLL